MSITTSAVTSNGTPMASSTNNWITLSTTKIRMVAPANRERMKNEAPVR